MTTPESLAHYINTSNFERGTEYWVYKIDAVAMTSSDKQELGNSISHVAGLTEPVTPWSNEGCVMYVMLRAGGVNFPVAEFISEMVIPFTAKGASFSLESCDELPQGLYWRNEESLKQPEQEQEEEDFVIVALQNEIAQLRRHNDRLQRRNLELQQTSSEESTAAAVAAVTHPSSRPLNVVVEAQ